MKKDIKKPKFIVYDSWFHNKGEVLYQGRSESQAIKEGRKHTCSRWDSECKCGGARIIKIDDGMKYELHNWQASKPFHCTMENYWMECGPFDLEDLE